MATLAALFTLSFHAGRTAAEPDAAGGGRLAVSGPDAHVAHGGAVVDINAHLGGCLAGACIAFVMLIAWNDEEDTPPARSIAAVIAGLWLARDGACALPPPVKAMSHYARPGLDFIPPAEMPKDVEG